MQVGWRTGTLTIAVNATHMKRAHQCKTQQAVTQTNAQINTNAQVQNPNE